MAKLILSHPSGNANTRGALDGFYKANILSAFVTSIAVFKKSWYYKLWDITLLSEFKKRTFSDFLYPLTKTFPFKEMGRQISIKVNAHSLTKHETGFFSFDSVCKYIDKKTSSVLDKIEVDAVYCYEDIAIQTFTKAKKQNIKCIYDLPIGYWRYMRHLLSNEMIKNADWSTTLGGFADSEQKTSNKDQELALADKIYVASTFTKKSLELYPGKLADIEVIPYGFPKVNKTRKYRDISKGKISLLYVGGLSQRKGLAYLFKALEGLDDFKLSIIGSGNIDGCKALKNALSNYDYLGTLPHDQVLATMAKHDILIFPSLFEGFGLVITEAMSQGTPVITTDRTCGPDIMTDGIDGWIVEAGSADSIRQKLIYLSNHRDEITKAGQNSLKTASMRPWSKYEEELAISVNKFINNK